MAGEWRDTTLGEFVTLQRGHDLTESERRPGAIPVLGAAGQNGFHDTAISKGPGLVVSRRIYLRMDRAGTRRFPRTFWLS